MLQEQHKAAGMLEEQCAKAERTAQMLDEATAAWHVEACAPASLLEALHLANFELWHLEDLARDLRSGDVAVAATKRSIDGVNQRRNDTVEAIDTALLASLAARGLPDNTAALHSETPGQMLDRLSILSLKVFHTAIEAERADADPPHRQRNQARLLDLREQQADLAACLHALWLEVLAGARRFKLYRQMKMYNDPELNPVLYRKESTE